VLALQEIAAGHIDALILMETDLPPVPRPNPDFGPLDFQLNIP
jgi:hypothetical protein